jgi:2-oxoglutarate ferredoxin oxidoreductase subunit alpha
VGGKGAYFVRGSGHDQHAGYTEDSDAYQEVVDRLKRKIDGAADSLPAPVIVHQPAASIALVTIGGCQAAVMEAADRLRADGMHVDVMRIRGFPFHSEVRKFLGKHEHTFVIEQNRDGQLRALLMMELGIPRDELIPVLDYGGMPLAAETVVKAVTTHFAGVPA